MKWDTDDFEKLSNATFTFKPQHKDPILEVVIRDAEKAQLKTAVGKGWFIFQLGTIKLTQKNVVEVSYLGEYPYWYGGWSVDWFGLVPAGSYSKMVTLESEKSKNKEKERSDKKKK